MDYHSLILGVIFSLGAFALKIGFGLHYRIFRERDTKKRVLFTTMTLLMYLIIFWGAMSLSRQEVIVRRFDFFIDAARYGMHIHFLMAALLMVWGVMLLHRKSNGYADSMGWIPLVLPCPVCLLVIFATQAILSAAFPETAVLWMTASFAVFIAILLATLFSANMLLKQSGATPERFLGSILMGISAYFLLSIAIMPQFADIDKVYRLAGHIQETNDGIQGIDIIYTVLIGSLLFAFGFINYFLFTRKVS